jgi:glycosyltransferase involved in cell wall biosynthesis
MAVYNERPYLGEAVQSVIDQTFTDFEFIITNDGSTDGSKEVLERFEQSDDRICLVHRKNRGLIASLNRGLDMARGKYVARMDGDDISRPERFERQVSFLERNPEIGILCRQADESTRRAL